MKQLISIVLGALTRGFIASSQSSSCTYEEPPSPLRRPRVLTGIQVQTRSSTDHALSFSAAISPPGPAAAVPLGSSSRKKNFVHRIRLVLFTSILTLGYNPAFANPIEDQQQFIHMLATRDHVSPYYTRVVLSHAKLVPSTITKITTPYEAQPFNIYITHFLTPERIAGGVAFWREHQRVLMQAQARYGVSPYMITAILGIETVYGKKQGATPVLDSLYTLAFYYPPRARFFREELAQYFIMCYEKQLSPYTIRGSYAGAFGMPQFMPSSYLIYSVAYNGRSAPDIVHNTNDAIMSIANYFAKRGWRPGLSYAGQLKVIMRYNTSMDYAKTAFLLAQAIQSHATRS